MKTKTWKIALTFGLPWTLIMIVVNSFNNNEVNYKSIISTLIGGLIAGFGFPISMKYFGKMLYSKISIKVNENEQLIREGGANHFRGKEAVGGKLVLTNKRLIFKSHKVNVQNHEQYFELNQIETVLATKTFNFFQNGLTLNLTNSEMHKFVVDEPSDWVSQIEQQRKLVYKS
jgi:hypothetical protein